MGGDYLHSELGWVRQKQKQSSRMDFQYRILGPSRHALLWPVASSDMVQWVAGIKKTGFRGTPPFLSLSTALTHPTPWFLSSGRHSSQREPARMIFR